MPDPTTEAIGGWIRSAEAELPRHHRRLEDIDPSDFDPARLAYFQDYRQRYFNDRLIRGQGVEQIQDMLAQHGGRPLIWADLGAGVTTLFWSIGVVPGGEVCACDLVPEALQVLAELKESQEIPGCYADTLSYLGKTDHDLAAVRRRRWSYHVMDCLSPWAIPGRETGFDLVTAIGCFGLAANAVGYRAAFRAASARLAPSGRIAGADWIRSSRFMDIESHDNRYLSAGLVSATAAEHGLRPLAMEAVKIADDPYYDAVIVWAFGRDS